MKGPKKFKILSRLAVDLPCTGVEEDDLVWGGTKEIVRRLCGHMHMATTRGTQCMHVVDC